MTIMQAVYTSAVYTFEDEMLDAIASANDPDMCKKYGENYFMDLATRMQKAYDFCLKKLGNVLPGIEDCETAQMILLMHTEMRKPLTH